MKNEVIGVLQSTLHSFKNNTNRSRYICRHIELTFGVDHQAPKTIRNNIPSPELFPEIYNHYTINKDDDGAMEGAYWQTLEFDWQTEILPQKIKYLELLIAKLQSE